ASTGSPAEPSHDTPTIGKVAPTTGAPVGAIVTIEGTGFAPTNNVVKFGAGYIKNIPSADGTSLSFTVPDALDLCAPDSVVLCPGAFPRVAPGEYAVAVISAGK